MGGDRAHFTTLLVALAVLCLVIVGARWVVLARRAPLSTLPATVATPANRSADYGARDSRSSDSTNEQKAAGTAQTASNDAGSAGESSKPSTSASSSGRRTASADTKQADVPTAQHKLELNGATVAQLDLLPGIGPALAQRIVDYRRQKGPFKRVEELLNVNGIGERKLAAMRELVYVKPAQ